MDVLYACIHDGDTIVGEYSSSSNSKSTFHDLVDAARVQGRSKGFANVTFGGNRAFSSIVVPTQYTITTVSDSRAPSRRAQAFIQIVRQRIATQSNANCDFNAVLKEAAEKTCSDADGLTQAQTELNGVKQVMASNIDRLRERGERVGLLVDRTSQMSQSADVFNRQATHLQRRLWWQNKAYGLLGVLVLGGTVIGIVKLV